MDLRFAVVDDNRYDRQSLLDGLSVYFAQRPALQYSCAQYPDAESFLQEFVPASYSLVFLDIQMGGLSGIDLAARLRAMDRDLLIVFTTTSREFAFDAFPIHPFDYLVKPLAQERLNTVLSEAIRAVTKEEATISVKVARNSYNIPVKSIVAVTSRGHQVDLLMENKTTLASTMRFSDFEKQLSLEPRFLSCNRGILINMDYILSLDGDVFRMKDGNTYPIRVRDRSQVLSLYTRYMISWVDGGAR